MKPASVTLIRQELNRLPQKELVQICLRLARYRNENKELMSYLLFETGDEEGFLRSVKHEITQSFSEINTASSYYIRKSIRKILRTVNKYIRFSGSKQFEVEMRLFFCRTMKNTGLMLPEVTSIVNLYAGQLEKVRKLLPSLHEDLRHDYQEELKLL
ncbi:MAG: hypothetical protein M9901_08820 [Lentimicrobium sp.]|nr:hypothetical protein [Lentimicrobium sp.]